MSQLKPRVAISDDFLRAYSRLPQKIQKKVRAFTEKFRQNPTPGAINYEPIHDVVDDKVRTVRIDLKYRAVVIHPPAGDVFLCVWVDNHDEAMDWARKKRFEVNPTTGALQVYSVLEGDEPAADEPEAAAVAPPSDDRTVPETRLLGGRHEDDLLLLGVPELLLPSVRALRTETDLDELAPYLPSEAADGLYLLAAGAAVEEALDEQDRARAAAEANIDTDDFAGALDKPESQSHFKLVEGERDLMEMLNAPLAHWRVFLHPSQRKLVRMNANGPVRVLGGAGTGKTVVAMHRAAYLAREVFDAETDRILLTTFTRNLALDLEQHLDTLCGQERSRIEVANLHLWAVRFMRQQGVRFSIVNSRQRRQLWDEVLALAPGDRPGSFYEDEWAHAVQANDVTDRAGYLRVRRVGRGTRLSRGQRGEVWEVLSDYRAALDRAGKVEWADLIRETRMFLQENPELLPYRAVIADEVQDFRRGDLLLLRAMVPPAPADLFLVGDAHQRIYGHKASLGSCGIEIRGRSRRLKINYRTTEAVRRWAVALLDGIEVDDLDDGLDTMKGYRSLRDGQPPEVRHFENADAEAAHVVDTMRAWLEQCTAEEICIVARTSDLISTRYRPLLDGAGIHTVVIETDAEASLGEGVRLATMHRVKGLEFPRMMLVSVQDGVVPLVPAGGFSDTSAEEDHETQERSLLHVAATRARDRLAVVGFGQPSALLQPRS